MAGHKTARIQKGHHRVVTPDVAIDQALDRAKGLLNEPRVTAVEYKAGRGLDLLILKLSDGRRRVIPREELLGLEAASKEQIARVEIAGNGTGLHWPDLDVDLYVSSPLRGLFENKEWMANIGRVGGIVRSAAKKRAARTNGLKGGRPRRKDLPAMA